MPKPIIARCQKCGNETEVEWTLGTKCSRCGSDKFFPVVHVGGREEAAERTGPRRVSQKPTKAIAALIFFLAAITALVISIQSTTRPKEFYRTSTMMCTNCEKTFRYRLLTRDVFPKMTCPNCEQNTAYRAVQCRNCKTIFPLKSDGKSDPTIELKCPKCGSYDTNLDSSSVPLVVEGTGAVNGRQVHGRDG